MRRGRYSVGCGRRRLGGRDGCSGGCRCWCRCCRFGGTVHIALLRSWAWSWLVAQVRAAQTAQVTITLKRARSHSPAARRGPRRPLCAHPVARNGRARRKLLHLQRANAAAAAAATTWWRTCAAVAAGAAAEDAGPHAHVAAGCPRNPFAGNPLARSTFVGCDLAGQRDQQTPHCKDHFCCRCCCCCGGC